MHVNKKLLFCFLFIFSALCLYSQTENHKWLKTGGKWVVSNSRAIETRRFTAPWNYIYIMDFNTIHTLQDFSNYNAIEFTAEVFDREKSPVELTISFAVRSEYKSWYYHMYGLRFTGDFWNIDTVELIHSDRKDKTLPYTVKNNKFVNVLASGDCRIKYGKTYNYRIAFEGEYINLYVNGEKIFAARRPVEDISGKIAISSGNAKLAIDKVRVLKDSEVIFEDDFNTDTIYVKKIKATLEVKPKDNATDPQ